MATVNTQVINLNGIAPTYNAASGGGDKFSPGERTYLHVKNGGAGPITVTVVTPITFRGLAIADVAVSVPATTGERVIGPFPATEFRDPADGLVAITWSGVTTVTFAVLAS